MTRKCMRFVLRVFFLLYWLSVNDASIYVKRSKKTASTLMLDNYYALKVHECYCRKSLVPFRVSYKMDEIRTATVLFRRSGFTLA